MNFEEVKQMFKKSIDTADTMNQTIENLIQSIYLKGYNDALKHEQKIGKWIDDKCSVCGKGIEDLISSPEWYRNEEPKFCPFCGVKLEGDSE